MLQKCNLPRDSEQFSLNSFNHFSGPRIYNTYHVLYILMIYFSMNMDRAGANADCYSMLERNENWIEDWFETDPDSKGKRYL